MAKSEIGDVINVLREAPTRYQVRLPYGGTVVVEHTQIEPQRMTLLTRGTRLHVSHELGKVLSASTDLAMMMRGKVRQVLKQTAKTLYQVETDQGKVVVLEQSQVVHHPQRDLLNGAELDLHLSEDGRVIQAMLVVENDRARLVRIESERLQVSVLGSQGDRFTVRLPASMEGCPRCSYIPDCAEGNVDLNKLAGIQLISSILGKPAVKADLRPFIYCKKPTPDFEKAYKENEYSKTPHGIGEEAPQTSPSDPFNVLRVQPKLHAAVAKKAFEVRSREIDHETPPLSASELNIAYQEVLKTTFLDEWR